MNQIMRYKERRLLLKSLKEGLYVFRDIFNPPNKGKIRMQEEEDLSDKELAQYKADIKLKNQTQQGAYVGVQTQQTLTLWNYQSFKDKPEESIEDSYLVTPSSNGH
ncbi:hypothetical protein Tco_0410025 [Tanacetum coccineum]